jgi:hypothetical protein
VEEARNALLSWGAVPVILFYTVSMPTSPQTRPLEFGRQIIPAGASSVSGPIGSKTVRADPGTRRPISGSAGLARRLPAAADPGGGGTNR